MLVLVQLQTHKSSDLSLTQIAVYMCCSLCVRLQVLDRLLLARLLAGLDGLDLPAGVRARGPAFCVVQSFGAGTADAVAAAGEAAFWHQRHESC